MSLERFTELIGCGTNTYTPGPEGGSFWSITIPEAMTMLFLLKPNSYDIQLMAAWGTPAQPLMQMLGRGYASELDALPVVQHWVDYLRGGHTVQEWKAHYGITRSDGRA